MKKEKTKEKRRISKVRLTAYFVKRRAACCVCYDVFVTYTAGFLFGNFTACNAKGEETWNFT